MVFKIVIFKRGVQKAKVYSEAHVGGLTLQKRKISLASSYASSWQAEGSFCVLSLLFHELPYFGAEFSNKNINERKISLFK